MDIILSIRSNTIRCTAMIQRDASLRLKLTTRERDARLRLKLMTRERYANRWILRVFEFRSSCTSSSNDDMNVSVIEFFPQFLSDDFE